MKAKSQADGASAIDLLEEAVHLLRGAPVSLHAAYALGTLPFALAFFLYFWADMSHGAFAREHADREALAMALLFVWMKCWQAVFAAGLRALRIGHPATPWTLRRVGWLALKQAALQPSGLFALPLALVILIPFAWVSAFYQNLTALGAESGGLHELCHVAARQARSRPAQNHIVQGLLSIFACFVWLNVFVGMAWAPHLLKTLLGVDTAFTQAGIMGVLNTTFLAASFALTYVFVDPLVKAVFVLRCFYGQSLQTGEDLKTDLARFRVTASMAAAIIFLLVTPAWADAPKTTALTPATLNQSIDEVLQRPEFAWRMPREAAKDSGAPKNWFQRAMGSIVDMLRDGTQYVLHSLGQSLKWLWHLLKKLWPSSSSTEENSLGWASAWASFIRLLLLVVIIVIAALLAVLLMRLWKNRRRAAPVVTATPIAMPDLNDDNVAATQLPEEGWLSLARELMAQGNLRLALRAFYLAGLASLAARELIVIATFKSNREYELELGRRARVQPAVQTAFSQNVAAFDRAWYGLHNVTHEALQQFQSNLEQIRSC